MRGRWLVVGLGVTLAAGFGVGQWQLMSARAVVAQEDFKTDAPARQSIETEFIDADPFTDDEPPAISTFRIPSEADADEFPAPPAPASIVPEGLPIVPQEILMDAPEAQAAAQTELERQYLEASREIFRSLTEQQQREILAATLAQLKQTQAMGRLAKLKAELQTLAKDFPETEAARMALDAVQRLEQPAASQVKTSMNASNADDLSFADPSVHTDSLFQRIPSRTSIPAGAGDTFLRDVD